MPNPKGGGAQCGDKLSETYIENLQVFLLDENDKVTDGFALVEEGHFATYEDGKFDTDPLPTV